MNTPLKPQRVPGERGPNAGATSSSAGENTPQPVCYARLDGTEMRFAGVSAFLAFWLVEQRRMKRGQANA